VRQGQKVSCRRVPYDGHLVSHNLRERDGAIASLSGNLEYASLSLFVDGADEYGLPLPAAVTDLRVMAAITGTDTLTATLRWTAPADAVTYTLRYSDTIIADAHWESAITVNVPFTASMPGVTEWFTVPVSYATGEGV
jgi:hypothetical protein